jgi:hypothetical protein
MAGLCPADHKEDLSMSTDHQKLVDLLHKDLADRDYDEGSVNARHVRSTNAFQDILPK